MKEKLLVFAGFHYDAAYMKTFEEYLPRCFEIIDKALDFLDAYPDYIFCIEQIILVDAYWQRKPEQRKRFRKHASERRLIFCPGSWTMPDGNIPSAESCYQNVRLGRKWLKEHLDVEPGPICWMADIFGHHAQSPQIYRQLGYTMYMFERGQLSTENAVDFFWEGIDGTKLFTHWEIDTYYGLNIGFTWLENRADEWVVNRIQKEIVQPLSTTGGATFFSKIGGDFLVPKKEHLEFIARWNKERRNPLIQFARPETYVAKATRRKDIKTLKADLNPLFQGTYSSRIRFKQFNRQMENIVYGLEVLELMIDGKTATGTEDLWRLITKQQFHDIICGSLADKAWKECLEEYESGYVAAQKNVAVKLRAELGCKTTVFNPLPYERQETIDLPDGPERVVLPPMEVSLMDNLRKVERLVPVAATEDRLENGLIDVAIDEYGRVKSIADLTTGISYRDKSFGCIHTIFLERDYGDLWGLHKGPLNCSLLHTTPYSDPPVLSGIELTRDGLYERRGADPQCFSYPEKEALAAKNGKRGTVSIRYKEMGCIVHYTVNAGEKFLRIRVEHKTGAVLSRLRAVMPTGITKGTIRREIPAGWIRQPEGEYPAQNWMDYHDKTKGMCLLNKGLPGNNVTDGVMMLTLFRATAMIERGIVPDYELDVAQVAEYGLYPFKPGDSSYNPTRLGRLFNLPPIITTTAGLPDMKGLRIILETEGAEIMAMRPVDHQVAEIRLYEASGKGSMALLRSSKRLISAKHVTPTGKCLKELVVEQEQLIRFFLCPFEIATIQLKKT